MKRKLMLLALVGGLIGGVLTGCGAKETSNVETEAKIEETVVETTVEEVITTAEETTTYAEEDTTETSTDETETLGYVKESKSDDSTEETKEVTDVTQSMDDPLADGVFTEEEAMYKINRLYEARQELFKSNDYVAWNIIDRMERYSNIGHIDVKTKDGYDLNETVEGVSCSISVLSNYFYDYVNNNSGYYDFTEYIQNHTFDEIINKYQKNTNPDSSNDMIFGNCQGLNYIYDIGNVTVGEVVNSSEWGSIHKVNHIDIAYKAKIYANGEYTKIFGVFDEKGNLLNLHVDDDFVDPGIRFTFEGSDEQ